jgi:hypothetical protein
MQQSQKYALICVILGAAGAIGFYWLWPHAHWAVYPVTALLIAGALYKAVLEIARDEAIVDAAREKRRNASPEE